MKAKRYVAGVYIWLPKMGVLEKRKNQLVLENYGRETVKRRIQV